MAADPPGFASRDPLSPQFWDERFARSFTPWDRGGVPQALRDFVARNPAPLSTLIPGCGSAYELAFLCAAGWDALAIDFAPEAVARGRALAGQWGARVVQADFFAWQPSQAPGFIYECAFLCALPPAMRAQLAARWAALLPPGALLGGFFFFDQTVKGPPFGIDRAGLAALLAPCFDPVEDAPVADSIPIFAGKERWMLWRRRA
ncbi:TPMT family class I SAM-dependent methyltransferase [Massilia sp. MS-15]|uniref:TPMT family class I SAM-dependent methyltransferase n=1 Tax=Massilia sp. MS-15 TaxID=2878200 RepID=UPI001CD2EDE2|nr:TPMT family class I SAM-dependent methyltransferase [Massilia sp. MS-15]MCA1247482.1 TPMT family class I SAM-dependent methyltransferase [Massilia sp. MS-15]